MPGFSSSFAPRSVLDPAGPAAASVARLWWLMAGVAALVVVLVVVLVVRVAVRSPRGPDPDRRGEVPAARADRWIVGLGVLMPAVVLVGVLGFSVGTMATVSRPADDGSLTIEVTGYQYWWSARYGDGEVTVANELHIPVGEPVELRLLSADVIHSFWVPSLQGKIDMLPDGPNTLVIQADEPGEYAGVCAEFCGVQHARMRFVIVAEPRERFEGWLEQQARPAVEPGDAAATRGRTAFVDTGCATCHAVAGLSEPEDDAMPSPDLTHFASRSTFAAATESSTTEALRRWLTDPHEVKPGTTMPETELTDAQVDDLVAFLEGLE